MLKCKDIPDEASLYVDHNLPWHRRLSWRIHLLLCNNCRRFIRHFKLTVKVCSQMGKKPLVAERAKQISQQVVVQRGQEH